MRTAPHAQPTPSSGAPASTAVETRPRLTWTQDLVTVALATIMEVGGILDGWAHSHIPDLETVLTPWHGVLYAGYVLTAGWIALQVMRCWRSGRRGINAVPVGYGLGVAGVAGWGVAGLLDLGVWHQIFGIEQGIEALLSPTHLMLATAEILIVTSPLRAAWSDRGLVVQPTLRALLPAVWSTVLAAQLVGFMLQYHIAFLSIVPTAEPATGIATVLVTNALLIGPMLLLLSRFRTPFGTFTVLYTGFAALLGGLVEYSGWPTILAALAGGTLADVLTHRLRGKPAGPRYAAVAGGSSLALWSGYLVAAALSSPFTWSVELWGGAVTLAVGSSVGLALLTAPTRCPAEGEQSASPMPAAGLAER